MLYGNYLFSCVLLDDAHLPPFKGSTFRGLFGTSLKKVVCALRRQNCGECLLKERCVYTIVFETPGNPDDSGKPSPPHPFIIEPPLTPKTELHKGEIFNFNLVLFGRANELIPYFVYAIERMGKTGIGRRVQQHRARFELLHISENDHPIYNNHDKTLKAPHPQELLISDPETNPSNPYKEVRVSLVTPLRVKYLNRLQAELPFSVLTRTMLRRIHFLNHHFGNGSLSLDNRGLIQRSEAVETVKSDIRWFDWERYSNRQERSMLMGGMIGEVIYRGHLSEFLPLLRLSEKIHLGKATTFGLGKIRVTDEVSQ